MLIVLLPVLGYGLFQLYEHRGAEQAVRLAAETPLPGEPIACSQVAWAGQTGRCAASTKDAATVAKDFVDQLDAAGVNRVAFSCLDPGSCTVEARTSFRSAMLLIVIDRAASSGRTAGSDMEITTKAGR